MLRTISIAAAVAGLLLAPATVFAASKHHNQPRSWSHVSHNQSHSRAHAAHRSSSHHSATRSADRHWSHRSTTGSGHREVHVHRNADVNVRIGHRYHGGVWYGARRHYWRGRWYAYGVGSCWLATPIGFVWVCGV